jgi:hypothetical protein
VAWLARTLAGAACTGCAVTARVAHVVARPAAARRWMESGKELGGGAHPSSGVARRRRGSLGATTFGGGGGCKVVTDDHGMPL